MLFGGPRTGGVAARWRVGGVDGVCGRARVAADTVRGRAGGPREGPGGRVGGESTGASCAGLVGVRLWRGVRDWPTLETGGVSHLGCKNSLWIPVIWVLGQLMLIGAGKPRWSGDSGVKVGQRWGRGGGVDVISGFRTTAAARSRQPTPQRDSGPSRTSPRGVELKPAGIPTMRLARIKVTLTQHGAKVENRY